METDPNKALAAMVDDFCSVVYLTGSERVILRDKVVLHFQPVITSLKKKAEDNWDTVEDVAIGGKITCVTCNQLKPCMCDKK